MVLAAIGVVYFLIAANFFYSLRLAYSMALHANGGGYPIMAHAAYSFFGQLLALILLPSAGEVPIALRSTALAALLLVPALNAWLIIRLGRHGERRRVNMQRDGKL
jgi:hypothetical protein